MVFRLPQLRLAVLSTVILFALIELGLAAALTSTTQKFFFVSFSYAALAIATSVITMATVPAMIALEIMRPGGVTSMIIVELSWLNFLWILWLATGAQAAQASAVFSMFFGGCGPDSESVDVGDGTVVVDNPTSGICHETSAITAFAFLNWIILLGYTSTLLVMSLIATNRKQSGVWQASVANAPFSVATSAPVHKAYAMHGHGTAGTAQTGTVQV
ncbi:hypothetical protein DFH09DRAFT_1162447 [Mycena vulgaris]|nr:hypothetical protein DFH09DRAFT_1162447 [Mycena vulgaris]